MSTAERLSLAVASGVADLPEVGRIAVFAPRAGQELTPLPAERCHVITGFKPDFDDFAARGFACAVAPEGRYTAAVVVAARSKPLSFALIARAAQVTDGPVIVDGAKTDGIEALLKDCRRRTAVTGPVNKAHGKLFAFTAGPGFEDWLPGGMTRNADGFLTLPGVFSADGVDPGSRLLADNLPVRLGAHVADLGAGWGYLSLRALDRDDIEEIHLVEANHDALSCARQNLADARAALHWEDASRWRPEMRFDTVLSNPPFHTGRAADPALGRSFIAAAARIIKPRGQFLMVANRHLPYEADMARHFTEVTDFGGDNRFKLLRGARPSRKAR